MLNKILIIGISILIFANVGYSQELTTNSANFDDPRSTFANTSLIGLKVSPEITVGYERFYYNISNDDLHNAFLNFVLPIKNIVSIGLKTQYFNSYLYQQGLYSMAISKTFFHDRVGIGADIGFLNISYDQSDFKLDDLNDPVFANKTSKTSADFGVGCFIRPLNNLYLGFSINHLNEPNISLIDSDVQMPIKINSGIVFNNSLLSPLFSFESSDGSNRWAFGLQKWLFNKLLLQSIYDQNTIGIHAALVMNLKTTHIRVGYQLMIPQNELGEISDNSHQLYLTYNFRTPPTDFQIQIEPNKVEIYPGESAEFAIHIKTTGPFKKQIKLASLNNYTNFITNITPNEILIIQKPKLQLLTNKKLEPGNYNFTIMGKTTDKERRDNFEVTIKPFPKLMAKVKSSVDTLYITETTTLLSHDPLLPYIFFDENQSELSAHRYKILNSERSPLKNFVFFPENLLSISSKYKNTLNVIAKRLRDNPQMQIKVIGYNSGWGEEKGNLELSKSRAQAVCDYLIKNCGVHSDQLIVDAQQLPPDPAKNTDPLGREENQRVEITGILNSEPILEPITTETSEITTSDSVCHFQIIDLLAESGISKWKFIIIEEPNDTFKVIQGVTLQDNETISWDWKNEAGKSVSVDKKYSYQLSLEDSFGQTFTTALNSILINKISEIKEQIIEKKIEKNRLILFKYDHAEMALSSELLQKELKTIAQKLYDNSNANLLVQGHTDIIGHADYNMKLSFRRAESVAKYFMKRGIGKSRISVEGFGINKPIMDNNLPEGRMINRRVEIYINY